MAVVTQNQQGQSESVSITLATLAEPTEAPTTQPLTQAYTLSPSGKINFGQ